MRKRMLFLGAMVGLSLGAWAQEPQAALQAPQVPQGEATLPVLNEKPSEYIPVFQYWKENNVFQHLDLSVTAGTTGIGIEASSPIGEYLQLRAGYDFMPRFHAKMKFDVTIGGKPAHQYDAQGNPVESAFDKMQRMMLGFSGYEVEDHVDMIGKPTMNNFKLLLDFFPFKTNKHWHFTAGFYWGPSQFAMADNTTEAMTSLLAVGIYNRIYERAQNNFPLMEWEDMGISDEIIDKYHLNFIPTELYQQIVSYGRLGFTLGTFKHEVVDNDGVVHKAGETYNMEPGDDGMIHVRAKSNPFKPYVGFGYGGNLVKGRDDWKICFDAGVWFWGRTKLYTHDGIDLLNDVENIGGQVGDYVDLFKAFKVYPVLNLRITKRLF
ncbi:MAG: hypothetical protein IJ084_03615 [Prevotella sp.]|nr:hypothetical protein [Prevotella sp.]